MFDLDSSYPRDLKGYGANPPNPHWPNGARLALEFVLAYETGGELCVLHGDPHSESMLTDVLDPPPVYGNRHMFCESSFEFGSRVGMWRLLRLFEEREIKATVFAVAMGLHRYPEIGRAVADAGHEIVSHGWRWMDYQYVPEEVEREHIQLAIKAISDSSGSRPVGWMTGRPSPNTRRLLVEEGGFLYDRDALNDELPYWVKVNGKPHLILPYYFDTNDNAFDSRKGFVTGDEFYIYLREAFDFLYKEGAVAPKMMTVCVHDRLTGRPGRASGFEKFLDYVMTYDDIWICRGKDIAAHWRESFPPDG